MSPTIWRRDGACDFALDPSDLAPRDRLIWRPDVFSFTTLIGPPPDDFPDAIAVDPDRLPDVTARFEAEDGLHIIMGRNRNIMRVRFERGCQCYGTVQIPGLPYDRARLETANCFLRWLDGVRVGTSPEGAWLTPFRRHKLTRLLCVADGIDAGATLQEIGAFLLAPELARLSAAAWSDSAERKRIGRWAKQARNLIAGGYRDLLRGK